MVQGILLSKNVSWCSGPGQSFNALLVVAEAGLLPGDGTHRRIPPARPVSRLASLLLYFTPSVRVGTRHSSIGNCGQSCYSLGLDGRESLSEFRKAR